MIARRLAPAISLFTLLGFALIPFAVAQEDFVPLFVIERNSNANVVRYDAKLVDGKLDAQQPVVAYWVMAAEDGRRKELNLLERYKAYGFEIHPDQRPESFVLTIVSDKKKLIHVSRNGSKVIAEAHIGNCDAYLEKIFVAFNKKNWLLNIPDYAEMIGTDKATGAKCSEKVTPADR
jgi:hypothetical protein